MEVRCLSVPAPKSYLLCTGIAPVENRGFSTDYRGTIYIHSTGRRPIAGMPDMAEFPVPVIHEFNECMAEIAERDAANRYIAIPDGGVRVELKNEEGQTDAVLAEYALLADVYRTYRQNPRQPYFLVNAFIGTVDLVDVVENSNSPWAETGYKHWVLANPVLFAEPFTGIRGSRTGLWTTEIETG